MTSRDLSQGSGPIKFELSLFGMKITHCPTRMLLSKRDLSYQNPLYIELKKVKVLYGFFLQKYYIIYLYCCFKKKLAKCGQSFFFKTYQFFLTFFSWKSYMHKQLCTVIFGHGHFRITTE